MLGMLDNRRAMGGLVHLYFDFGASAKNKASQGISQAGGDLYDRTKLTPQESSQYSGSFDLGQLLEQVFKSQSGLGQAPQGYDPNAQYMSNPLNKTVYDQTLAQAQNPDKFYQSTLQPGLMQAQDSINSYYQKRGLLNSGLAIEGMGRAGVDLALQEAQQRMAFRQQSLQNAQSVGQTMYGMNQNNMAGLANLYSGQQGSGINAMNRQAQGATAAAGYQAYPYQAMLGDAYGKQGALGGTIGTVIGAGAGFALGGPMGASIGSQVGGGVGRSF